MAKRGQTLSMTTIIIAALALLVLVILALIFTGRMGFWTQNVSECKSNGGVCRDAVCEEGEQLHPLGYECKDEFDVCCLPLTE